VLVIEKEQCVYCLTGCKNFNGEDLLIENKKIND
jgi:hypothetical protein